jgi:formamidopyrimidine-DNA glycosylase
VAHAPALLYNSPKSLVDLPIMPELPEVETVVSDLRRYIRGGRIESVDIRNYRLRRPIPTNAADILRGNIISDVSRRAKCILCRLQSGHTLLVHLGMSGSLIVSNASSPPQVHDHVVIQFSKTSSQLSPNSAPSSFLASDSSLGDGILGSGFLTFNDPRRFGLFLVDTSENIAQDLAGLGVEPLECDDIYHIMRGKRAIKETLTDVSRIVGIGNIYASEILFHAGISPLRTSGSITPQEANRLLASAKVVLQRAVALRGSTIKDYRDSCGEAGGYQNEFLAYDREGKSCHNCGTAIVKIRQSGRATYMCEVCQSV